MHWKNAALFLCFLLGILLIALYLKNKSLFYANRVEGLGDFKRLNDFGGEPLVYLCQSFGNPESYQIYTMRFYRYIYICVCLCVFSSPQSLPLFSST